MIMRANPGGEIAPEEVVGRDRLIHRIWQTLEGQSVVLVAERRMGKSCVVKKMAATRPEGVITIYRDVEGIDAPAAFAERVYRDVYRYLGSLRKATDLLKGLPLLHFVWKGASSRPPQQR